MAVSSLRPQSLQKEGVQIYRFSLSMHKPKQAVKGFISNLALLKITSAVLNNSDGADKLKYTEHLVL